MNGASPDRSELSAADRQPHASAGGKHQNIRLLDIAGGHSSPMTDVYLSMMRASAIISAGELGLFNALSGGPLDAVALAQALHASLSGTTRLADFLVTIGYLEKGGQLYGNAPGTARWFTAGGEVDFTPGLAWSAQAWGLMGGLTNAVIAGAPAQNLWEQMLERPALGAAFSDYMRAFAEYLGPDLISSVALPHPPRRMLDLGGSHGLHSIRFCQHHPQLTCDIVDLPSALTGTDAAIARAGLAGRIALRPANLLDDCWDVGEGYDLILYLSVAHNQSAEDNRRVMRRIFSAMRPRGLLVIHEYLAGHAPRQFDTAFRLTLLVETATRTYGLDEISDWLRQAGFAAPDVIDLHPRDKGAFIIARKSPGTAENNDPGC